MIELDKNKNWDKIKFVLSEEDRETSNWYNPSFEEIKTKFAGKATLQLEIRRKLESFCSFDRQIVYYIKNHPGWEYFVEYFANGNGQTSYKEFNCAVLYPNGKISLEYSPSKMPYDIHSESVALCTLDDLENIDEIITAVKMKCNPKNYCGVCIG